MQRASIITTAVVVAVALGSILVRPARAAFPGHGRNDGDPVFSPSGRKIAYDSYPGGGNLQIKVMRADGSHQHKFTPSNAGYPSWGVRPR